MICLGIDCATKTGWALVERESGRERLLDYGVLDISGKKLPAWNPVAALALRCRAPNPVPDVVAIELPYLDKNVATALLLARLCGRFEQAFGPSGAQVVVHRASEWQSKILGRFGGRTREELKKAVVLWGKATFGVQLPVDAADAAGGATHVLRSMNVRAAMARAAG